MNNIELITNAVRWIIKQIEEHPEKIGDITYSANVALMLEEIGIPLTNPFLFKILQAVDRCDHTVDPHWEALKCLVYGLCGINQKFVDQLIKKLAFPDEYPDSLYSSMMCTVIAHRKDTIESKTLVEAKEWLLKDIERRVESKDPLELSFSLINYAMLIGKDEQLNNWTRTLKEMQKEEHWHGVGEAWNEIWVTAACVYNLALLEETSSEEVQKAISWLKRQRSLGDYWENIRITSLVVRALGAVYSDRKEEIKVHVLDMLGKSRKLPEKTKINEIPGKYEKRVFIGGNYDYMAKLREIKKYVKKSGFQTILAYDFDVPKDKIHDYDLRLLHNCKYAIFDETDPAGELMEIERAKDYRTTVLIVYGIRDPEMKEPPSRLTSMVATLGYEMYGYSSYSELKEIIMEWLKKNKSKLEKIAKHPGAVLQKSPEGETTERKQRATATGKLVFIVHGRDQGTKEQVARFLEKLELKPVILHEQPSKGRTIIEKFEDYSDVAYAVILLTPDDVGKLASEETELRPRARQNVVFELGFFIGKLGRKRVCALYQQGIELPSDFHGVVYVPLDKRGAWKLSLVRELKAVGLEVDLDKAV